MTDQDKMEELIRQRDELIKQQKALSEQIRILRDNKTVCGRAEYRIARYLRTIRPDEYKVIIRAYRDGERNNSIIIAHDKATLLGDLKLMIEDLINLKNKLEDTEEDDD